MAEVGTGNSSSKANFFRRVYVNLGEDEDDEDDEDDDDDDDDDDDGDGDADADGDGDGDELPFPHHTHQTSSSCFEDPSVGDPHPVIPQQPFLGYMALYQYH